MLGSRQICEVNLTKPFKSFLSDFWNHLVIVFNSYVSVFSFVTSR